MLRNQNMACTLGTTAGNPAGQVRGTAKMRQGSVSVSVLHSDSSEGRQGYPHFTGNGLLGAEPDPSETKQICLSAVAGDPSAAIWARLIVSRALIGQRHFWHLRLTFVD